MRGRKPMPTALKIKAGVSESRINHNEPKAEGEPIPPAWLSEGARRAWGGSSA